LEFVQWLKHYFDLHYDGQPYDAVSKRPAGPKGEFHYILGGNKVSAPKVNRLNP